jgi:hypothetical protein
MICSYEKGNRPRAGLSVAQALRGVKKRRRQATIRDEFVKRDNPVGTDRVADFVATPPHRSYSTLVTPGTAIA